MKEIYLVKTKSTLRPAYASDKEVVDKIPIGTIVKAGIRDRKSVV